MGLQVCNCDYFLCTATLFKLIGIFECLNGHQCLLQNTTCHLKYHCLFFIDRMNDCKENFAETKKEPFDQDAILQTVKNISLKTSKSSCSEKLANVVNFERPLSYIVAPASRDNEALDLTTKPKDSKTPFALDLSKKLVKDASNKTNKKKDAKPQNKGEN